MTVKQLNPIRHAFIYCKAIHHTIFVKHQTPLLLFIFGCAGSPLLRGLFSSCGKGGHSLVALPSFSLLGLLLLQSTGSGSCGLLFAATHGLSSCGSWALEHRLNHRGSQASLLGGMWDLPGLGIEPVSCIGRWILYHRATREAQDIYRFKDQY